MNSTTRQEFKQYIDCISKMSEGIERKAYHDCDLNFSLAAKKVQEAGEDLKKQLDSDETILELR